MSRAGGLRLNAGTPRPSPALAVGLVRCVLSQDSLRRDPSDSPRMGCAPTYPAKVGEGARDGGLRLSVPGAMNRAPTGVVVTGGVL
jgi:hypothetical protein